MYFERNEDAITESQNKYGKYCLTVAHNILSDPRDAEECINDTWLCAWNTIPPKRPEKLGAYLSTITRNNALKLYRDRRRLKRGGNETEEILDEIGELASACISVEDEAAENAFAEKINEFLSESSERERNIFVRRFYFFDTSANIGKKYGISESNVRKILSRLRTKLKKFLESEGYTV